ncbi:MAG: hypothetical protein P4L82_12765 [Ancalomicrobiaceae bacterium]|nr:hypothetical protein [Ancalomicrobiaceae bacterium]
MSLCVPARLTELFAAGEADVAAGAGAALAAAQSVAGDRPCLWVRQTFLDAEAGAPYALGLLELGLDPAKVILVKARTPLGALQAGLEGARSAALGTVIIETWGEAGAYDLTASRRLALAAEASGTAVVMLCVAANPRPSAATTRWQVAAAGSEALPANAPGRPSFHLTLLRAKRFPSGGRYLAEWDRDARQFSVESCAGGHAGGESRVGGSAGGEFLAGERSGIEPIRHSRSAGGPPLSGRVVSLFRDGPGAAGDPAA